MRLEFGHGLPRLRETIAAEVKRSVVPFRQGRLQNTRPANGNENEGEQVFEDRPQPSFADPLSLAEAIRTGRRRGLVRPSVGPGTGALRAA